MNPDSPHKVRQNKQKLYSSSQASLLSETAQKNTEKDTQFYLTYMNKPIPLILIFREILPGNSLVAIKLTGAKPQLSTGFHGYCTLTEKIHLWHETALSETLENQQLLIKLCIFLSLTNFVAQRLRRPVITSKRIRSWIRNNSAEWKDECIINFLLAIWVLTRGF